MSFVLGKTSLKRLEGVDPRLVCVVKRAIELTEQDFSVFEGVRTLATQKEYVARGVSKTLNSRHLTGDAVDLVPYIKGKLRWEVSPCFKIAEAVRAAADELELPIRWGGNWRVELTSHKGFVNSDFATGWDFVHYEIPWRMNDEAHG